MSEVFIARKPFKGSSAKEIPLDGQEMVSLTLFNDSNSEVTFKAGVFEFTVAANDAFDERIDPFTKLEITAASGSYRGYCRIRA
ncbi:hypothetical protein [Paenibacillus xanthanilyticus]|uniref:Uncharacterized protein n=1 Tax=Paenibacillus xanthanilyticus TaxID=1783531 RepID=A0ABV8KC37_9BACL